MSSTKSLFAQIVGLLVNALTSRTSRNPDRGPGRPAVPESSPGEELGSATIRIDPLGVDRLRVEYTPERDGAPDAGEIIWTWVPYEENDGRGKDRPVLVIGRQSDARVYAVRMTSKPHDGHRDYLSIGSGAWDGAGRESWVDIEELYSVHESGMRREAAILDRARYDRVAQALVRRYGWRTS
ncbi:type II toxin-antitoxin system PemK/MazF family toxin [Microbacterium sp. M]|uniref:type II toxin-antitoxin system PemK/MazF family toxin n=1 Tax=Microbacterium sp. M TaxID=3377125 RepID=UPI00386C2B79